MISASGVSVKMGDRRLGQLVDGGAGGVELAQQRGEVNAHRGFDVGRLVQVGVGEDGRNRSTSRSRSRRPPAVTSSRRSRAGVSWRGRAGVGAAATMARASGRASPPLGSSANAMTSAG